MYRPTYTANTVEDVNRDSNAGLQSLVGNLMQIQARKEARARQQMLDERQRQMDQMAAEDRARKIRDEEDARQIWLAEIEQKLAAQQKTPERDLGTVEAPSISIETHKPDMPKTRPGEFPVEEPTATESADYLKANPLEQFNLGTEQVPASERIKKITLHGGQQLAFPMLSQEDLAKQEEEKLLRALEYSPTVAAAALRGAGRHKPILDKVDLGDKVRVFYEDGTTEDLPRARDGGASGVLIPITNPAGNIVGFYNNRTAEFQSAEGLPEGARRSGVAATEMAQRGSLESIINDAKTLAELSAGEAGKVIGPVSGTYKGMTRGVFGASPDVQDLFHISDNLADQLLRARSGAQINEQEFKRLRVLVPNPRDSRSKFDADLRRFTLEAQNVLAARQGKPIGGAAPEGPPPGQPLTVGKYKVTVE